MSLEGNGDYIKLPTERYYSCDSLCGNIGHVVHKKEVRRGTLYQDRLTVVKSSLLKQLSSISLENRQLQRGRESLSSSQLKQNDLRSFKKKSPVMIDYSNDNYFNLSDISSLNLSASSINKSSDTDD